MLLFVMYEPLLFKQAWNRRPQFNDFRGMQIVHLVLISTTSEDAVDVSKITAAVCFFILGIFFDGIKFLGCCLLAEIIPRGSCHFWIALRGCHLLAEIFRGQSLLIALYGKGSM